MKIEKMNIKILDHYDPKWLSQIISLYNKTELKRSNSEKVNQAFQKSFAVISCWQDDRILGIGRMISDGEMYSGIFDLVVDPAFQKQGIGKQIMEGLIAKAPETCVHLSSTFGNEAFYYGLGFIKHKTAMALYPESKKESPYLDREWKPAIKPQGSHP